MGILKTVRRIVLARSRVLGFVTLCFLPGDLKLQLRAVQGQRLLP